MGYSSCALGRIQHKIRDLAKDFRPTNQIKEDSMRFSMREWLKLYRETHKYGEKLKLYHYGKDVPQGKRLSRDTAALYIMEIDSLTERTKRYLDGCGLTLPPTAWEYRADDKTTWPSHESFKYGHLMPKGINHG
jgi:hypothetical protein